MWSLFIEWVIGKNFLLKLCKKAANEGGNTGVYKFIVCPLRLQVPHGMDLFFEPQEM